MPLSQQRRSQLDSIIIDLDSKGAPVEDVQAIVADFKAKYENETGRGGKYSPSDFPVPRDLPVENKPESMLKTSAREWAPNTVSFFERPKKTSSLKDVAKENLRFGLNVAQDIGTLPVRAFAAATGQGEMEDPNASVMTKPVDYLMKKGSVGEMSAGAAMALDPGNYISAGGLFKLASKVASPAEARAVAEGIKSFEKSVKSADLTKSMIQKLAEAKRKISGYLDRLTPEQKRLNAAAEEAGIPLSTVQKNANPATNLPGGISGMVDQVSASFPLGRLAREKQVNKVVDAVHENLADIKGAPIFETSTADLGEQMKAGVKNRLTTYNKNLNEYYGTIDKIGGSEKMGGGFKIANRIKDKLGEELNLFTQIADNSGKPVLVPTSKNIIKGLPETVARDIYEYVDKIGNLDLVDKNSFLGFRKLRQEVGAKMQAAYEAYHLTDKTMASDASHALGILYKEMTAAERDHINKVAGPTAVQVYDGLNKLFARNVVAQRISKKIVGIGDDVGDFGYKTAGEVAKELISPRKIALVPRLIPFFDKETALAMRSGILAKFIEKGANHSDNTFSMARLENALNEYKSDSQTFRAFQSVVGPDVVKKIETVINGAKRAGYTDAKFADPRNKSGTGQAVNALGGLFSAGMTAKDLSSGAMALSGLAAINYAARFAQVMMNEGYKGLNAIERGAIRAGIGAALGATEAAVSGRDKSTDAIIGGALGAFGVPAAKTGAKWFKGSPPPSGASPEVVPRLPYTGDGGGASDIERLAKLRRSALFDYNKNIDKKAAENLNESKPYPEGYDPNINLDDLPLDERFKKTTPEEYHAKTMGDLEASGDLPSREKYTPQSDKEAILGGYLRRSIFGQKIPKIIQSSGDIDLRKLSNVQRKNIERRVEDINTLHDNDYEVWQYQYGAKGYPDKSDLSVDDIIDLMNTPQSKAIGKMNQKQFMQAMQDFGLVDLKSTEYKPTLMNRLAEFKKRRSNIKEKKQQ